MGWSVDDNVYFPDDYNEEEVPANSQGCSACINCNVEIPGEEGFAFCSEECKVDFMEREWSNSSVSSNDLPF